ncbi:MAG TPA: mandelate racemase/muconate lactonizing enzyme family protein [Alphaproteobacteria bacterium]|nr:mandelate racemase/muconate lactonizing enzyme family protein [Alphaproteobacteria bacterium]
MRLRALEARVYRVPIDTPVRTSFGIMRDRPAVLVRAIDEEGAEGWGEIWCNFPSVGAEHRARLVEETIAPLLVGRDLDSPAAASAEAGRRLEVLAIQSGEPGPIAQAIAGIDIALWDLAARRVGAPLFRLLGGMEVGRVPVYASGLNPDAPDRLAAEKHAEGHRAFKLKVGFGRERDVANLAALRAALGDGAMLMIDANQAWALDEAVAMARAVEGFGLKWLEEPLRADAPRTQWAALAASSSLPLAAGENLRGEHAFADAVSEGVLGVVQPDIGKWGGFSGCVKVGRDAIGAGLRFCPHWLGGGVGLVASLHLLAAVGGDGLVEVDANPNPLRPLMATPFPKVVDGAMALPVEPGLGVAPDLKGLREFEIRR